MPEVGPAEAFGAALAFRAHGVAGLIRQDELGVGKRGEEDCVAARRKHLPREADDVKLLARHR